ncbi:hypothetical protein [Vibrio salinus]|uniref:hypothetical protein n=1 Tax=Vibrio salinus TaxID=2899784 RepID=UPI001E33F106|nr:hypothetical protein [Vibrio salinus]MCE0493962.1 hypothetical protein [Vibrio salinus]
MLHDINFMDWQEYQQLQRKRGMQYFCLLILMVFLWIESGFFLHWQYKTQLLKLAERDYQQSLSFFYGLQQQVKRGEQIESRTTELRRIADAWEGERRTVYEFLHALKASSNVAVSVKRFTQNQREIEMDGTFLSQKQFHTFLNVMGHQSAIQDVRVIAVSADPQKTERSPVYSQFRIYIRMNSHFPSENRRQIR